jgi:hypothetical protein
MELDFYGGLWQGWGQQKLRGGRKNTEGEEDEIFCTYPYETA